MTKGQLKKLRARVAAARFRMQLTAGLSHAAERHLKAAVVAKDRAVRAANKAAQDSERAYARFESLRQRLESRPLLLRGRLRANLGGKK